MSLDASWLFEKFAINSADCAPDSGFGELILKPRPRIAPHRQSQLRVARQLHECSRSGLNIAEWHQEAINLIAND